MSSSAKNIKAKATKKSPAKQGVFARLATLYSNMEAAYDASAHAAGLSCQGCTENCCTSYFQHHTYIEWLYLWRGMMSLPEDVRERYIERAHEVVAKSRDMLAHGQSPRVMCPLNDDGLCGLYKYRLMICRMHGTRNIISLPDGRKQIFVGCVRYHDCVKDKSSEELDAMSLDRTPFYRELATLEMEHLGAKLRSLPRVDLTLAEMLVKGAPRL